MPWENRNRHYDVNSCYLEGFSEDGVRICSCCRCHKELCNVKGQRSPNHPEPDHRAVLCSETVFDEPTKRVFQGEKSLRWNICTLREQTLNVSFISVTIIWSCGYRYSGGRSPSHFERTMAGCCRCRLQGRRRVSNEQCVSSSLNHWSAAASSGCSQQRGSTRPQLTTTC